MTVTFITSPISSFSLLISFVVPVITDDVCYDACQSSIIQKLETQIRIQEATNLALMRHSEMQAIAIQNLTAAINRKSLECSHVVSQPGVVESALRSVLNAVLEFIAFVLCTIFGLDYVFYYVFNTTNDTRRGSYPGCLRWIRDRAAAFLRRPEPLPPAENIRLIQAPSAASPVTAC